MGGPLRRPTKFDCGATLQQSSNIFYQKFVEINSVGSCGEEKGFKGKGIAAAAAVYPPLADIRSPRFAGLASRKIFRAGNKKQKVDTLGPPTHPRVSKKVLP